MRIYGAVASFSALSLLLASSCFAQVDTRWKIHDLNRPVPPIVTPGTSSTQDAPGKPPADAVVLFDGKDLSQWLDKEDGPAKWKVENGYFEVAPHTGYVHTRTPFGDCQLHVEFSEPVPPKGESQDRGNSGVFLMGLYEIQVLDSYENKTYADGQAAAVYGQYPPLVNASRPPGNGNPMTSFSTVRASTLQANCLVPRASPSSTTASSFRITSNPLARPPTASALRTNPARTNCPLALQDHGNPVRYRNIWIRELSN